MKNIILTFVGITNYKNAVYCTPTAGEIQTHFGLKALMQEIHHQGRRLNDVFCFVTDKVVDVSNLMPSADSTDAEAEYEANKLKRNPDTNRPMLQNNSAFAQAACRSYGSNFHNVSITENIDFNEFYSKVVDATLTEKEDVNIYIDITNCLRSAPVLVFPVFHLVQKIYPNVRIREISYWQDVSGGNNCKFAFFSMLKTYSSQDLAEELEYFKRTFHIGKMERYMTVNDADLNELLTIFKKIERALEYVNSMYLCEQVRLANEKMKALLAKPNIDPLLKPYIQKLADEYESYCACNDAISMSIQIARKLYDCQQIQIAITFAEGIYNTILLKALAQHGCSFANENLRYNLIKYMERDIGIRGGFSNNTRMKQQNDILDKNVNNSAEIEDAFEQINRMKSRISRTNKRYYSDVTNSFINEVRNAMQHGDFPIPQNDADARNIQKKFSAYLTACEGLYQDLCNG